MSARRWRAATRATKVTSSRVAASARWRSSRTRTTGRRSPSGPRMPSTPSMIRRLRRSGSPGVARHDGSPARSKAGGERRGGAGRGRRPPARGPGAARRAAARRASGRGRGRSARTVRPCPAGVAAAAEHGHRLVERPDPADRLVEEPGDADARRAAQEHRSGLPAGGVVEHGRESRERVLAPDEPRARVPAGHAAILGRASEPR